MSEPMIPAPSGKTSNLDHPDDALHTVNEVTQLLCIIVSTIVVIIRLTVRIRIHKSFTLEDCAYVPDRYECTNADSCRCHQSSIREIYGSF